MSMKYRCDHDDRLIVDHQPGRMKTSKASNREWFSRTLDILIRNGDLPKSLKGSRIRGFNQNYEKDYDGISRGSSYWTKDNIEAWSGSGINMTELRSALVGGGLKTYVDDALRRARWTYRAKHGWNDDSSLKDVSEIAVRNAVLRAYDAIMYGADLDTIGLMLLKSDWMIGHYPYELGDLEALSLGLMNLGHGYFPVSDLRKGDDGLSWVDQASESLGYECGWEVRSDGVCMIARPLDELGREILVDHSKPRSYAGPVPPCWTGVWAPLDPESGSYGVACSGMPAMRIHGLSSRKNGYEVKNRPAVEAADRPYWTLPNGENTFPGVVVDVDRPRAWSTAMRLYHSGKIPMWSYAIINHDNGHAQFTWIMDPVSRKNRAMMMRYDGIVRSLNRAMDADRAFARHRSQNPCWYGIGSGRDHHEVVFTDGVLRFYTVTSMMEWLDQHHMVDGEDLVRKPHTVKTFRSAVEALSDNSACGIDPDLLSGVIIPEGRRWEIMFRTATWLASHGEPPELAWSKVSLARGSRPFTRREFSKVVSKVKRYRARIARGLAGGGESYKSKMALYGRRGGLTRSEVQIRSTRSNLQAGRVAARSKSRAAAASVYAANMLRKGETKRSVASRLGMSRVTFNKHLKTVGSTVREIIVRKASGMMSKRVALDIMSNGSRCSSYGKIYDALSDVMLRVNGSCDLKQVILTVARASIMTMEDDGHVESNVRHGRSTVESGDMDTTVGFSRDGPERLEDADGW